MLLLFATTSQAQQPNNYQSLWDRVDQLEVDGLPKSALEVVNEIKTLAQKDDNRAQLIKTMLFQSKFALILEEDAQITIVNDFKTTIASSKFPEKNILQNILANLYWQYFNQHRWQFYNRSTSTEKVDATDFRTWDLETLFAEIDTYFQASLESAFLLQQEDLATFDVILDHRKDSKKYRPTLFDFLSHNALEFYKTPENSISKPAYAFKIDNPDILAPAVQFEKLQLEIKDTASLPFNALKIYQGLTKFHVNDAAPYALEQLNIARLQYVKENAVFPAIDQVYLATLQSELARSQGHETSGLYNYRIAELYHKQGLAYNPKTNTEVQWKLREALELCERTITQYPESAGAIQCQSLKEQLLQPSIQLTAENHIPLNTPSRVLISYKNIKDLHFTVYPVTQQQRMAFQKVYRENEKLEFIKALKSQQQWEVSLPQKDDFQTHSTEVVIPKLANGTYLITSTPKDEDRFKLAHKIIQVTNLAVVTKADKSNHIFQVINRNTGAPVSNAQLTIKYKKNYRDNENTRRNLTTDAQGEIRLSRPSNDRAYRDVSLEIHYKDDEAYFNNGHLDYRYYGDKLETQYQTFLFTDRSIYRPSQTVYFKGIVVKRDIGKSAVMPSKKVKVLLYNTNREKLSELNLTTNDYGSFSAEFILPNGGLNGQYSIAVENELHRTQNTYFSVEEYKRPKFETTFIPITETYQVNDSVKISGKALAFSGTSISDGKVVFRVKRNVQYPSWYRWYYPNFYSESQEITFGETTTNDKGEFDITFKAIPDTSVDKKNLPVFNYEVTADVTDINGETRSSTTIVKVGYHALTTSITVADRINKDDKKTSLTLDTKNLNGEFVPSAGSLKIYKLQAPGTVLRPRPWEAPDLPLLTKEAFKAQFPNEAYANEVNPLLWEKGEVVFETAYNTANSKEIEVKPLKKWQSGKYLIVAEAKDKFGQDVKDEARFTLFSKRDNSLADNELFSINIDKDQYAPNDNAVVTVASAAQDIAVTIAVEKNHKVINTLVVRLNNSKQNISIPVTKDDIGGFVVHYTYAAFNHFQGGSVAIAVPYPKTDLEIETLTFRDKLQPGTLNETWTFKVKGPKGDQVSAELLASMYDASLDQFKSHSWGFYPILKPTYYNYHRYTAQQAFGTNGFNVYKTPFNYTSFYERRYDEFNWFGLNFSKNKYPRLLSGRASGLALEIVRRKQKSVSAPVSAAESELFIQGETELDEVVLEDESDYGIEGFPENNQEDIDKNSTTQKPDFSNINIRKNLQETAFFFPQLATDAAGNVSFSFTTPEALTQWKLQLLAHTKELHSTTQTLTAVTQKELSVVPNAPRFLREGDQITISSKISNLTDKALSGFAKLVLTDAVSGEDISTNLINNAPERAFTVDATGNTQVSWELHIPNTVQAVQYKILARAGDYSDGEQNALPVLSNRMLVTETLPMWVRSNQTKTFTLDKLKNTTSSSLKHHKLTLEMTSNPAWYAVQALPYLMEYPYDCNEQTFSKYYANALASHIANFNPRIQEVFNQWKNSDALLSNLEKNEELKNILIQETPWLRDAQSESQQKKRIALLFDLNKMTSELNDALRKLKSNQLSEGSWPWFKGGRGNRWVTQHIATGFGHLDKLNVASGDKAMLQNAINYLDRQFVKEYRELQKYREVDLNQDHLSYTQLHYLYMRSFYPDIKHSKEVQEIANYYYGQIKKYWLARSLYAKGLMALIMHRAADTTMASKILASLKETSITSEELGMYWKENTGSWFWHQAPIETQALLIEAFAEINPDSMQTIDNLKIWLLKNKQTNRWKTTKATTEAVYALLLQGSDWLSVTDMVDVTIGDKSFSPSQLEDVQVEAGTGYYKTFWSGPKITPQMAEVTITKKDKGIAWGGLYWQYFEDLDKITSAETPLQLKKKLFLKKNTDKGEEISEITSSTQLKVGDLVRVRIELRSDRAMEFIHLKDMRAAGFEPINVLSQYKWQDGLGYYESTKDAATNFFFDYLPKGIYVFEYDLRVNNAGDMSNGISTIQSMYAPEFISHSEGLRVKVE